MEDKPKLVIVGGGWGVSAARSSACQGGERMLSVNPAICVPNGCRRLVSSKVSHLEHTTLQSSATPTITFSHLSCVSVCGRRQARVSVICMIPLT